MGKISQGCASFLATLVLAGCAATSPVTEANLGREQPLVDLVMSGKVTGNTMLPFYETTKTVFCGLVPLPSKAAEAAIAKTLQDGVDVNKPCRADGADMNGLPLDVVVRFIGYASEPGTNYDPVKIKLFIARAQTLLQAGAKTARFERTQKIQKQADKAMTLDEVLREASDYTDIVIAQKEHNEKFLREAAQKKFFNLEAIAATLQIVGMAANNYTTIKGAPSTSSLPIAAVSNLQSSATKNKQTQAPAKPAQPTAAASKPTAAQTKLAAATPPAPAACLQAGSFGEKSDITSACSKNRNNTFGWGETKSDACEGANRSVREEFNGKNAGGCYCQANATVNSVTQPYVCWVMFD